MVVFHQSSPGLIPDTRLDAIRRMNWLRNRNFSGCLLCSKSFSLGSSSFLLSAKAKIVFVGIKFDSKSPQLVEQLCSAKSAEALIQ